jgi:Tfp pilus assembly protein PilO
MILIPQKLIIEQCLGINMASFMANLTELSRRTIANDLKGKPMSDKSRKLMMDGIKEAFIAHQSFPKRRAK